MSPPLTVPRNLWLQDGSLRDVYVHETVIGDWVTLLSLAKRHPHAYFAGGERCPLPNPEQIFANAAAGHRLSVRVGNADLNCHFFSLDEIELDIDPRQVVDLPTHEAVLRFVEDLAEATGRIADITLENSPQLPPLRFDPASTRWAAF